MPPGEFALIDRYFRDIGARRDVRVGVGDDGAVLAPPAGQELVAVVDTLVEGVHFPAGSPANSIGHRALAVNLSDIAAMGAAPAWALLALTLPRADERWLEAFAAGFAALARAHDLQLVGGDMTAGPLTVTVQVLGFAPRGEALLRGGARPGDLVCVTGTPGDAACGLALLQGRLRTPAMADEAALEVLRRRFLYPTPRSTAGPRLRGVASACIDISDGLAGDLTKLARASDCGVRVDVTQLPLSAPLIAIAGRAAAEHFALTGGDDYELCFTVPAARAAALAGLACTAIGRVTEGRDITVCRGDSVIEFSHSGFDHFAR
ncbi:MAG: Thiamine-monophosphate kinase [Steroidobacteraceae bacterium]|nr:Thiamine-monophosphate kinase [Steroidobacteraceae bacterium]